MENHSSTSLTQSLAILKSLVVKETLLSLLRLIGDLLLLLLLQNFLNNLLFLKKKRTNNPIISN